MPIFSNRFIGALMLIVGTSIGAGMFALPIACSGLGFLTSSVLIVVCWAVMLLGAFYILEVNLWLPKDSNMVTMAEKTLGIVGRVFTWIVYVLLLYALMSAYISGASDVLQSLLALIGIPLSNTASTALFTALFSAIVYQGIKVVEAVNTPLMFAKIFIYILLVIFISPSIKIDFLFIPGQLSYLSSALLLLITSFGFSIVIPSLREQFNDDVKSLRNVIFVGSLFPLVCYLVWNAVIMGVIPRDGAQGLLLLNQSDHATSELTQHLGLTLQNSRIIDLFRCFSAIGMLTAFLGVSLCLFDFLADSIKLKKRGREGLTLLILCFLPPFLCVMVYPGAYIKALSYAGLLVVVLLILIPALMTYWGRYKIKLYSRQFKVFGSKPLNILVILLSLLLLIFTLVNV